MAIFFNTGNVSEIEKFHKMGIIRGVTTNPTILLREGVTGGMEGIRKRTQKIAEMISPLSLFV
jgi:transaldolase